MAVDQVNGGLLSPVSDVVQEGLVLVLVSCPLRLRPCETSERFRLRNVFLFAVYITLRKRFLVIIVWILAP
jgi:hypothetical protein